MFAFMWSSTLPLVVCWFETWSCIPGCPTHHPPAWWLLTFFFFLCDAKKCDPGLCACKASSTKLYIPSPQLAMFFQSESDMGCGEDVTLIALHCYLALSQSLAVIIQQPVWSCYILKLLYFILDCGRNWFFKTCFLLWLFSHLGMPIREQAKQRCKRS